MKHLILFYIDNKRYKNVRISVFEKFTTLGNEIDLENTI